jgi:ABC-type sugar transport system substrate-binding protein
MGKLLTGVAAALLAETIGVSIAAFDDTFLTLLRKGMETHADDLEGVTLRIEDAKNDSGLQLHQIQTFLLDGVDALIVNPVDTDATVVPTEAAQIAGIPLVYVNRQPINLADLPPNQVYVGSDEAESGTLETKEVCRQLLAAGKEAGAGVLVLMGDLFNQATRQRSADIDEVIASDECGFMHVIEARAANWSRSEGEAAMAAWLAAGIAFDAVIANNDEMALGAIAAMKAAGVDMNSVVVAGIDATGDALAAMRAGDLDVTVFQNAAGQGKGAVDAALGLARGEPVPREILVPFELVTPANLGSYSG